MAKFTDGILGTFTGSVGAITKSSWKGIPYVKQRTRSRTDKGSLKEKQNQNKFSIAHFWLKPIIDVVKVGFRNHSERSWGFNAAKSYLLKNAFEGEGADIKINPALVNVSAGDLPLSTGITAERSGDEAILFRWDANTPDTERLDNVMMLAYDPTTKTKFNRTIGEFRYKGTDTLLVVKGRTYHLYLAFNAADRSKQSDSVYLGEISM
jgi:hypothetical protein